MTDKIYDPESYTDTVIRNGIDAIKPKGSQPADDTPVAVITIYQSSFVLALHGPAFDPQNPAHRHWYVERCFQAAQSVSGKDWSEGDNAVLSAPDVLASLAEAVLPETANATGAPQETFSDKVIDGAEASEPKPSRTHFEVYKGADGWRFRLRAGNGEPIASGEAYQKRADALHAIALIEAVDDETEIEVLD